MESEGRRPRVIIGDKIADAGIEMLREVADVDVKTGLSPEELIAIIGDYEAIIVRSATKVRANVIEHALKLKVIGRAGAGLDNIDVVAAKEKNIQVVNSPDANTQAVAEHTLALMLALARRLPRADLSMKEGKWDKKYLMGTGLAGKTLGLIGFGRIGRQVAIRAKAFGMRVLVNQRRPTPELNLDLGVEAVDLNDLLKEADFVSLHVPSRPETEKLIGAEQLAQMKPTAYLVNTARGTVIDEKALLEALDNEQIAGAALDVFVKEPTTDSALAQHARVIATPHIAASTEDAQLDAAVTVAKQIIDIIRDVKVENPLSLQVVPLEKVVPHEHVDPRRVDKLSKRLAEDGVLSNPPIVVETEDRYVVLDGATRTTALKQLGYPHGIVQVVKDVEGLALHTWYHAVRKADAAKLVKMMDDLPEIDMVESSANKVLDDMFEYGGLCYLHTTDGKVFLIQPAAGANRLVALNKVTNTYIGSSHVTRTLNTDIISLKKEYPDLTGLIVFPEYTVQQVLQVAKAGHVLPAGITRFVIPGRVLRLNAKLEGLMSDKSLREKNEWLYQLIIEKQANSKVRYYKEPVYLLDE
jgi:phosphoglycerate dehydrogenase-like enzyme